VGRSEIAVVCVSLYSRDVVGFTRTDWHCRQLEINRFMSRLGGNVGTTELFKVESNTTPADNNLSRTDRRTETAVIKTIN